MFCDWQRAIESIEKILSFDPMDGATRSFWGVSCVANNELENVEGVSVFDGTYGM